MASSVRSKHLESVRMDETAYDVWKRIQVKPFYTGISFVDKIRVRVLIFVSRRAREFYDDMVVPTDLCWT
jgi:hypothetical protein